MYVCPHNVAQIDIYQRFSCLTPTLVHWQGGSITVTVPIFITALLHIWPKGHWESCNKIGPQCPTKHGLQFELGTFWLKCNTLTHYKYLHLPIDEAPINFKFKFFENFIKNICSFTYMWIYLSIYPSIYPSIYLSLYLSIYPSIRLSIYLFIYLYIHIYIYIHIYRYI